MVEARAEEHRLGRSEGEGAGGQEPAMTSGGREQVLANTEHRVEFHPRQELKLRNRGRTLRCWHLGELVE